MVLGDSSTSGSSCKMPSIPSKLSLRTDVALISAVDRLLSLSSKLPKKLVEGAASLERLPSASRETCVVDVDGVGTLAGATGIDRRWRMKLAMACATNILKSGG